MVVSEELGRTLNLARLRAVRDRHEYVSLEHLLWALLDNVEAAAVLDACGLDRAELRDALDAYLATAHEPAGEAAGDVGQPTLTVGVREVLQVAVSHVQQSGRSEVTGANVLVALFRLDDSDAVAMLAERGVDRFRVVRWLSHGAVEDDGNLLPEDDLGVDEAAADEMHGEEEEDPLRRWCTDLVARAEAGRIDPLVGRGGEVMRLEQILARRRKNNPILIGEAGVGKTAIVEGLARRIADGAAPRGLAGVRIHALDLGRLLAGTRYRGEFEERLKAVVDALAGRDDRILFIDEIHTLIGAGAASGGSLDASNLLKPALANGDLRCIGTTTIQEYRRVFEKDHALSRRFQPVEVAEPTAEETLAVLRGLESAYAEFHRVRYAKGTLQAAVDLSARHIRDRFLPDKALDVLDEAGARVKLRATGERQPRVRVRDIEEVVASMAKVPPRTVHKDDRSRLLDLDTVLATRIFGQGEAVSAVVEAIRMARAGLGDPRRPIGAFLFAGPTGVGKTELARQLADALGIAFLRFDMSEYMEKHTVARLIGSPPGYVGFEQGGLLTEAVLRSPHAVLLLDEIEKAHEDLQNILLQIMDHATLTDNTGRRSDFRQIILVMTTNLGAAEGAKRAVGFEAEARPELRSLEAIERAFSPEFRNRLTAIVPFRPLGPAETGRVVDKLVAELEGRLAERNIRISLTPAARNWLAEHGHDPRFGARPMSRLLEREIARPLAGRILDGSLDKGGVVLVRVAEGRLSFDISPASA
jgi:ATP-dependent Clp protease ATP-binding subunit ClpA